MNNVPVVIEGVRLRLRRSTPADAADAFRVAAHPEVMVYQDWKAHRSPADATAYLQGCVARWEAGTEYHWMIVEKAGEQVLGSISCRVKGHAADFGYLLAREHWGRGLGTEAARLLVSWLQRQSAILRIWATNDIDNTRSARVLTRAGLEPEGVMRRATWRPQIGGAPRDTQLFAWVRDTERDAAGAAGTARAAGAAGAAGDRPREPRPVILDTDPGVDDAMALLFLHRHPSAQLIGITTVFGNAEVGLTTRNALFLAERFGIDAPVVPGAARPLRRPPRGPAAAVHGADGLGNLPQPIAPRRTAQARPAHRFIIDTLRERPGEISLIALGPMTNLALALAEAPEVARLAREVVVMGGAFGGNGHAGNVSPVAEANVFSDPHAADAVFTAPWPVTICGLDVTHEVLLPDSVFARLRDEGGAAGELLWQCSRHYVDFHRRAAGLAGAFMHDASAVACWLAPQLFTRRAGPVRVVCEGLALGQTIFGGGSFARGRATGEAWAGVPEQRVCTAAEPAAVRDLFLATVLGTSSGAARTGGAGPAGGTGRVGASGPASAE